ncbi:hypothetical protein [Yoonia sp. 2307UL14-13]|uniref:hypothetical protein n=1 Tax=Yoonia sp. 2307UL14-13 TaxID=3126506 RepID=UPI0030AEAD83
MQLADIFLQLSLEDIAIVGEPDWEDTTPFDGVLFYKGEAVRCEVMEDEITDESYLQNPKLLRKGVVALAGRLPS